MITNDKVKYVVLKTYIDIKEEVDKAINDTGANSVQFKTFRHSIKIWYRYSRKITHYSSR